MFGKDGIKRSVAGNTLERDVRHGFALESQLLSSGLPLCVDLGNPRTVRVTRHILSAQLAQSVVIELGGQQPVLGQRQRYAAGVDSDPAPTPLFGHIRRRPAPARRVQHQVAGVGGH